ncbi:MAG: tyrosine decarboxylase MfnA [Candidatus Thermoplasmatota archaeon]
MSKENSKQKRILEKLEKYRKKDFSYKDGNILGSMCTEPYPIAKKAYIKFLETNLGDPELFPGTKKMESDLINFIAKILHAPKKATGIITNGGTEGNITAIWLAKSKKQKNEIIVPESSHFSFKKIASLMNIKLKTVPLNNKFQMDIKKFKKKITNQTAAVVGIAGTTELGTIDPIPKLSEICEEKNIFLHVDAAFGGFVIPFLKKNVSNFDFKLKGVDSISLDAHKMGYSAIPLGFLMIRNKNLLNEISVESFCVSTSRQAGLSGTRSGGPVAAAYAVSQYLGIKGYKKVVDSCMKNTYHLYKKIKDIGLNTKIEPSMNVLAVKMKKPKQIERMLSKKGWKVNTMDRISCIRIVIMPHVTNKVIDRFVPDLENVCKRAGEI